MSTPTEIAGRREWPAVSRLALAFVALWVPLTLLALATGWREGRMGPGEPDSLLAEYVVNGSAVSGPLSAQLILLVLAFGAHRRGRLGLVATGLLGVMGAAIAFQGTAGALSDHDHAPQAIGTIAGFGFAAFGTTLLATAARRLLSPRQVATAAGCLALCFAAGTGTASAKVYAATGKAKSDPAIEVAFELKATSKKGALSPAQQLRHPAGRLHGQGPALSRRPTTDHLHGKEVRMRALLRLFLLAATAP